MNLLFATLLACTHPDSDSDTNVEPDPLAPGFLARMDAAFTVRYFDAFTVGFINRDRTVKASMGVHHEGGTELAELLAVGVTVRIYVWVGTGMDFACDPDSLAGDVEQELEASGGTVAVDFDADGGTYTIDGATFEREGEPPLVEGATGVVDEWQEPCEPD